MVRRRWHPVPRLLARCRAGGLADLAADRTAPASVSGGSLRPRTSRAATGSGGLPRRRPRWLTDYHRAVLAHGRGDRVAGDRPLRVLVASRSRARGHVADSPRRSPAEGRLGEAAEHAVAAARSAPAEWRLAAEAISRLLDDDRPADATALIDCLPSGDPRAQPTTAARSVGCPRRRRCRTSSGNPRRRARGRRPARRRAQHRSAVEHRVPRPRRCPPSTTSGWSRPPPEVGVFAAVGVSAAGRVDS